MIKILLVKNKKKLKKKEMSFLLSRVLEVLFLDCMMSIHHLLLQLRVLTISFTGHLYSYPAKLMRQKNLTRNLYRLVQRTASQLEFFYIASCVFDLEKPKINCFRLCLIHSFFVLYFTYSLL